MSFQNKRGALNQITKDDFEGGEGYSRDEPVEEARTADAATMSKRKVLPLPKRRGNGSSGSTPKASNGFSGLSSFGSGASPAPQMSFSSPSTTGGFTNTNTTNNDSTSDTTLKRIAMNEKFVDTISAKVRENAAVDLSDVVSKYLEYSKTLGGDHANVANSTTSTTSTISAPVTTATPTPASADKPKSSLFSFGATKNFSAGNTDTEKKDTTSTSTTTSSPSFNFGAGAAAKPAVSKPFSFGTSSDTKEDKPAVTTPAATPSFGFPKADTTKETDAKDTTTAAKPFTFGSSTPSGPSFSFNKSGADVAKEKTAPSFSFTAKKPEEKKEEKKPEPVSVDSDSDSDDDAIDITKGPSFTLAAPPTTTNSAFSFSKPQSEVKSTGPSFTFDKKVSSGPFNFKSETKTEEKKEDKPEEKKEDKSENKKDFTWNPSQGVVFGSNKTEESADKPAFSFGSTSSAKPFTFGAKADDAEDKPKPAFSFGSKSAESSDKPAFSFGAKPAESASSDKPSFSFGTPAFGAKTESSSDKPAFGVSSGNLFKGDTKGETKPAAASSTESGEPDDTPKTVTDSDDLSGQGPGEENEDNVAEYRTKLYKLDDGKWDVCGVGQLRVLVDKDTKKARILMRAEQSGRVLLNCVVRKELTYSTTKSNVNIVDFDADSKPIKYMARIKTAPEAEQLSAKIEEVK